MSNRDIIAIGGSLGAIEAVKRICGELPAAFPAAIFVVIHTIATREHMLSQIFAKSCPNPVHTAVDGEPVETGHIYLAPADHHLLVIDDVVRLGRGPRENLARPAIDPLFRSLAMRFGPRLIAVVLTGLLNDGAAGLADVKRCNGVTVVQSPLDAVAQDMPLGALRAAEVDYRAPAADLAGVLTRLVKEQAGPAAPIPPDIALEVGIALGAPTNSGVIARLADPVPISCPACGGVLSQMKHRPPLRFRCQVGHAFTAEAVDAAQQGSVDEAVRIALRIVEEHLVLVRKMESEARDRGRMSVAATMARRAQEYQQHADQLRRAALLGSHRDASVQETSEQAAWNTEEPVADEV